MFSPLDYTILIKTEPMNLTYKY